MKIFRSVGKGVGTVGGKVIGGTAKMIGKSVGTKFKETGAWIEDVGEGIEKASVASLDSLGQFLDGAAESAYGVIKKDSSHTERGLHNLKDSSKRTIKGVGHSIKYTAENAGKTISGLAAGDRGQAVEGLKNVGKVAAVATLAIGAFDLLNGPDAVSAETINDDLAGGKHPETGVPFEEKEVELSDKTITGTFPVFESGYDVSLPDHLYTASNDAQFNYANHALYGEIQQNPSLAKELGLSEGEIADLANGETPDGYTWHHHEEPGKLQLVDREVHAQTGHTGGQHLWAGGSENR